jgi:UDP-2-acetamido-2-deoxy-ribo-hexuluronate aminotransferase
MGNHGIETLIHYPVPIPRQPALAAAGPAVCPVADRMCSENRVMPLYPALDDASISALVVSAVAFRP